MVDVDFFVDISLFPTAIGGRRESIAYEGFIHPYKLTPDTPWVADARLSLNSQIIAPGETKRVGIVFLHKQIVATFRAAKLFYLWDTRIVGWASVVPDISAATLEPDDGVDR